MPTLKIEIKAVNELTPDQASSIRHRNDREFGNDSLVYADAEWFVLGYLTGELATHIGVLQRMVTVGKVPLLIGGVCYLVTEPEHRGCGFGSAVIREAVAFVKNELGQSYSLLTCKPRLEPLYVKTGWRTVTGPTIFGQATGVRRCGRLTMVNECGGRAWPEGEIDLCGLPW